MRAEELLAKLAAIPEYREAQRRYLPGRQMALAVSRFRADHDLTQAELAAQIGTTQSAIARLESGRHATGAAILNRIADAFGVDWQVTFGNERPAPATTAVEVAATPAVGYFWFDPIEAVALYGAFHYAPGFVSPVQLPSFPITTGPKIYSNTPIIGSDPVAPARPGYQIVKLPSGQQVPMSSSDLLRGARATMREPEAMAS